MNMETAGAETPAVQDNALAPDDNSASSTEQQPDANEGDASPSGETDGKQADAAAEVPEWVQNRINELTRKRREAERRADKAEKAARAAQSRDTSNLDYEDQIAEKTIRRTQESNAVSERETAQELAREVYQARVEAVQAQYPDYEQVAHRGWEPTPAMLEAILESDMGPQIAYHLGKNPAERARIANLSPVGQVRELGKLEGKISAPKTQPKTPPAPVKPVTGINAGGAKDPAKMSMSEYIKWREANP